MPDNTSKPLNGMEALYAAIHSVDHMAAGHAVGGFMDYYRVYDERCDRCRLDKAMKVMRAQIADVFGLTEFEG